MAAENPESTITITASYSSDNITFSPAETIYTYPTYSSDHITWIQPDSTTAPIINGEWQIVATETIPQGEIWVASEYGYYSIKGLHVETEVEKAKKNLRTMLTPRQRQQQYAKGRAKGQNCEFLFVEEMGV